MNSRMDGRDAAPSGGHAGVWDENRASPVVLRLLPYVHHPPCRVLVPGAGPGHEAAALNARGYLVTALERVPGERAYPVEDGDLFDREFSGFDLLCERGWFSRIAPSARPRYVAAAARALVPGGRLFGTFLDFSNAATGIEGPPHGTSAGELLHHFGPWFDVERLEPSAFSLPGSPVPQLEAIFVRR